MTKLKIDQKLLEIASKTGVWILTQKYTGFRFKSTYGIMVGKTVCEENILAGYFRQRDVYAFCKKYNLKIIDQFTPEVEEHTPGYTVGKMLKADEKY